MATRKAKAESSSGTNFDYEKAIRAVEISHKLTTTELSKDAYRACAISTGCLMQDLMFGGGIQPAWNTIWGGEGSAKTTTVQSISANILDSSVPFFGYFDYEQALDVEYFSNILSIINNNASYDKIFGIRNLKDPSKWDIAPRIRYYPHDVGEDFYLSMGDLLRSLPDKIYMQKKWWYVFDNTKTGRANAGPNYDKRLYQKEKRFYVEAQDGGRLQALMIIDSIQAMNPENQETGDLKKAMAQDARMHATHLKKVRSKLRRKHCAVLAIGQLRVNPGQMFGNPEYSSGGNTIKHAADVRQKHVARSSPNGGGPVEREASVLAEGGEDAYKYIHVKNEKNKFFTPHTEGWLRVWIDHEGNGRGFDPVYDCVTGDTLVSTDKGLIRIDEIPEKSVVTTSIKKGVLELSGLKALANDGKYHNITRWADKGIKDVYEVRTHHGNTIKATANHKVQVLTAKGELVWKMIKNLNIETDYLILSTNDSLATDSIFIDNTYVRQSEGRGANQFNNVLPSTIELTPELAYLTGYLVSDGHISSDGKQIRMYTSNKKSKTLLTKLFKQVFGIDAGCYKYESDMSGRDAWVIYTGYKEIHRTFTEIGCVLGDSYDKVVPKRIMESNRETVIAFLRGLYAGDGHYAKGDFVGYSSASMELILGTQQLLWNLGIESTTSKTANKGYLHKLNCIGESSKAFKSIVGRCPTKALMPTTVSPKIKGTSKSWANKLPMPTGRSYNLTIANLFSDKPDVSKSEKSKLDSYREVVKPIVDAGFKFSRINSIQHIGKERVYDIEVDKVHNFVGNGIVVHNCYMYLRSVGRIIGKLGVGKGEVTKTMIIDWPENGFYKRKITWLDFKALVLFGIFPENIDDLKQTLISLNFKLKGEEKYHNPKIRERCFAEIRDGSAFEAFQQVRAGLYDQDAVEGEDDDEEEDLDLDDEEDEDDDY